MEYAIEPAAYQEYQGALQQQQIYVKAGDQVQTGTLIARLLCTDVTYNHLHLFLHHGGSGTFLCAYEYSSAAAKATYDQIAATFGKTVCCSLSGQPGCS